MKGGCKGDIQKIGVLGAGTMGNGIAQVAAENGFKVVMRDIEESLVDKGIKAINKNLNRAVEKGKKSAEDVAEITKRIKGTVDIKEMTEVDLVIEAAVEKIEIKQEIYRELDGICKPQTIFASNTSGLSITEMAAVTRRADKVIGMHFFNPVPVMQLVEVIKGHDTSEETFDTIVEISKKLGKDPIAVNEAPLFAVNRILCPMINEAAFAYMEGVASAEDLDKGMRLGANHPIGPLALADLVGLDVLLMVMETLYKETGDSKYRPCPLIRKMVRAGHFGRKTGRGFYSYE